MFFAAGVSAYPAAMFHLTTHAFFKALLFLGAGSVIHAMSDEQDMRNMGGIWKHIPVTYAMMWIGSLALAGVPFFAGYYSKDMILEAAWAQQGATGQFAFYLGVLAAFLTAFYSWRLLIMTFHGKPRASKEVMSHIHESPFVMLLPLFVLAIGAIFSGSMLFDLFVGHHWQDFWRASIMILPENTAMENAHNVPKWVKFAPIVVGTLGIAMAYVFYLLVPSLPSKMAKLFRPIHTLFFNKWFIDELYDAIFVKPSVALGRMFWKKGDVGIIDAFGPDGITAVVGRISALSSRLQTGYVFHYAFAMLIGVVALIAWYARGFGG